jgi:hypothetical protein
MTGKYRRRDLTVGMRHKDVGLTVQAQRKNRRERHTKPGPCPTCGVPGMGDAYYDNYPGEDPRRCTTCGYL